MSEIQLMTVVLSIALSAVVAISAMIISNGRINDALTTGNNRINDTLNTVNNRMSDFKESLRAEIKASAVELRSEIKDVRMDIDKLRMTMERMDDNIARLLADHERRITKLEAEKA